MFVPRIYQVDGERWPSEIIDRHPLALLTTNGDDVPHATHVPVVRPPHDGQLVGSELLVHMNRANPHWAALSENAAAKLVFQGPDGYVTPSVYHVEPAVPTWDFVTVHLTGTLRISEDVDEILSIVTATARTLERRFGAGYDIDRAADHHARIAPGVGAIRFRVTKAEAMFKFSQEKDAEIRDRIMQWFEDSDIGEYADLGRLMRQVLDSPNAPAPAVAG